MKKYTTLLIESKQKAKQFLSKVYSDDRAVNEVLNIFISYDPSQTFKYTELFANLYFKRFKQLQNRYGDPDPTAVFGEFKEWFDEHPQIKQNLETLEKRKISVDINKFKTLREFYDFIKLHLSKVTKSQAKQGLSGLTAGRDYIEIPLKEDDARAFIPLSFTASRVIASDRVGSCEGKWCTAYQKDDQYWKSYIYEQEGILVYIVNFSLFSDESASGFDNRKQAIFFYSNRGTSERFDSSDSSISRVYYEQEIKRYVHSNWNKIRHAIQKKSPKADNVPDKFCYGVYGTQEQFFYEDYKNIILKNRIVEKNDDFLTFVTSSSMQRQMRVLFFIEFDSSILDEEKLSDQEYARWFYSENPFKLFFRPGFDYTIFMSEHFITEERNEIIDLARAKYPRSNIVFK